MCMLLLCIVDAHVILLCLIMFYKLLCALFLSSPAKYLDDYVFLTVGRVGGATTDITQSVVDVGEYEKREKLVEILKTQGRLTIISL